MKGQALPEGLSQFDAQVRLGQFGRNEVPLQKRRGLAIRLLRLAREPLLMLLVAVSALYFYLGDRTEAIALGISALFIIGIEIYQDYRSERAIEALRDLSSPRALVIRGGEERRIPAAELVPRYPQ
jgi:Ca2+-transporting ATPase